MIKDIISIVFFQKNIMLKSIGIGIKFNSCLIVIFLYCTQRFCVKMNLYPTLVICREFSHGDDANAW